MEVSALNATLRTKTKRVVHKLTQVFNISFRMISDILNFLDIHNFLKYPIKSYSNDLSDIYKHVSLSYKMTLKYESFYHMTSIKYRTGNTFKSRLRVLITHKSI